MLTKAAYPSLSGRRVVVTGGGSGIGAAMVAAFLEQHAQVIAVDLAFPDSAIAGAQRIQCDLTNLDQVRRAFEFIHQSGAVDVLINNAANDDRHDFMEVTQDYWSERVAVNLRHVFFCAQAVSAGMIAKESGVIINMGSIAWRQGLAHMSLYLTAKAGIEGMTKGLARDLGGRGVRVVCIVPGAVRTERQTRLWHSPKIEAEIITQQCLKHRVNPDHVASLALFLASDDAAMCTGHEYLVDAGLG